MRSPRRHVDDIFAYSPCREPGPFTFMTFTIISILWLFCQLCLRFSASPTSHQPHSKNESRTQSSTLTERVITSLLYAIMCGILLLDGCWLATIYTWATAKIAKEQTHGPVEFAFTRFVLVVWSIFLLAGCALWVWAMSAIIRQLCKLWVYRGKTLERDNLTGIQKNLEPE
ncbi:hypothetical protein F5Y10DRAFT_256527 [Nemania abortiva]|nr:hypothetical protein F5Y10DRAFT_256527 [Nemania abortiva]